MIGKVLPPDQGMCHGLFGEGGEEDGEGEGEAAVDDEDEEGAGDKEEGEKVKEDILKKVKHTYVK